MVSMAGKMFFLSSFFNYYDTIYSTTYQGTHYFYAIIITTVALAALQYNY